MKSKMPVNIAIDIVMLIAIALVSISGFILEVVIPSRHAALRSHKGTRRHCESGGRKGRLHG